MPSIGLKLGAVDVALPIVLFVVGFGAGAFIIWQVKQKEIVIGLLPVVGVDCNFFQLLLG